MSEFLSDREAEIFYAEQRGYASVMEAERKLHEASIEELQAKLAKVTAAYRTEAMRRDDYTHEGFDKHIAEITGGKDE